MEAEEVINGSRDTSRDRKMDDMVAVTVNNKNRRIIIISKFKLGPLDGPTAAQI